MGNASVLIPMFKYYPERVIIASTNDTLVFRETTAVDLTAEVESGTWSWAELAWKIKVALEAQGGSTYTVSYAHSTRKYTILSDGVGGGGLFEIRVGGANDGWDDVGYTAHTSGALTYTSDTAAPAAQTTLTATQRARGAQLETEAMIEVTEVESGRREAVHHGQIDRYTFRLEFESVAVAQGFRTMWDDAGKYGAEIDLYPDSTAGSEYVTGYWDTSRPRIHMMLDRGLYRLYEIDFTLRFKVPATGTIEAAELLDRRPS